jgi:hypothetical protein
MTQSFTEERSEQIAIQFDTSKEVPPVPTMLHDQAALPRRKFRQEETTGLC